MAGLSRALAPSCLMLALVAGPGPGHSGESNAIQGLAGRWAGAGTLLPASGPTESFKCIITYFPSEDGARMKQNLRCHGENKRFDAATHLEIIGGVVKGWWEDKVYSLNGKVDGFVTERGFDIVLSGQFFAAKMRVVSSPCEQSVTITPDRKDQMRELAAVLRKC